MKKILLICICITGLASCKTQSEETNLIAQSCHSDASATCTGSNSCTACKNCKYCKHCSKDGGSCGVCK